jgi:glucose-1-phosphate thymidylyltransferase
MGLLVFEDELVTRLYPITIGRPAYAITCAGYRLIDWLRGFDAPLSAVVRPHLAAVQAADSPDLARLPESSGRKRMLVNARLVPSHSAIEELRRIWQAGRAGIVVDGDSVAAAVVEKGMGEPSDLGPASLSATLQRLVENLPPLDARLPLLHYPHDAVRYNIAAFAENVAHRLREGKYREVADGVFAAKGATLGQYVVTDSSGGPIVLDQNAAIGPYSFLSGPIYVGRGARVLEHAAIKGAVSLGHTTKIGGEVEESVVEPYTNKQHHGFLGHSYLGSWINLGAGTCNSDLKNTYGEVKMEYRGERVASGMQFLGCIMGDYAKTAINTSVFTGKTIGACSMVYGFVTTNVPSFVNYARSFGQVTELPPEVMIATQQRMFARRQVEQRPCDVQLVHDMFDLTRNERQLAGEPLSL